MTGVQTCALPISETSALLAQRESERSAQAAQLAAAETARARASEAGRLLEAVAAKREADKATAVKDFLVRMFETSKSDQTDAQAKQNSTLAQFLVEAETKLRDAFPDQPLIKEEMLGVVGELHEELGMLDSALRLRKQLVDLRHRRNAKFNKETGIKRTGFAVRFFDSCSCGKPRGL